MRLMNRFFLLALVLGGLNMGGIGVFGLNAAAWMLGAGTPALQAFYIIVGIGALMFGVALIRLKILNDL